MNPVITIALFFTVSPLLAAPLTKVCEKETESVRAIRDELTELKQMLEELEIRFQDYCKEDFNAQIEGLANELHRNKAIKVAFAKRRLTKLIDAKSRDLASGSSSFCQKCKTVPTVSKDTYCDFCSDQCKSKPY